MALFVKESALSEEELEKVNGAATSFILTAPATPKSLTTRLKK